MSDKRKRMIRALMAETGLKYTEAARQVDEEWAREQAVDSKSAPESLAVEPFRSCAECGFVYVTEEDWRREYDEAAPRMLMPFTLQQFQAATGCPRCLHDF